MKITPKTNELVETLDKTINNKVGSHVQKLGLTFHYSSSKQCWEVFYGRTSSNKFRATGITLDDALENFVIKMNTPI